MNFASVVKSIDIILWGWPLISVLIGTHIFMTFRTGFIQKNLFKAIKLSVTKDPEAEGGLLRYLRNLAINVIIIFSKITGE